jgi:hypothetical protein
MGKHPTTNIELPTSKAGHLGCLMLHVEGPVFSLSQ